MRVLTQGIGALWAQWWRSTDVVPNWLVLPGLRMRPARGLVIGGTRRGNLSLDPGVLSNETAVIAELARQLKATRRLGPVDVWFHPDTLMVRDISIPKAGRRNADQIVGLDLQAVLPFPARDVATCQTAWRRAGDRLVATQFILKKQRLELLERSLAQFGGRLRKAEVLDIKTTRPFLDHRQTTDRVARGWGWASLGLFLTTCAVVILGDMQARDRLRDEVATLRQDVANLTEAAANARERQTAADAAQSSDLLVRDRLQEHSNRLQLLSDLTDVLGDETWVSELSVSGGNVLIAGLTGSGAAEIIALIEQQDWARNTQMSAPASRDARTGQERFQLRFELTPKTGAAQ